MHRIIIFITVTLLLGFIFFIGGCGDDDDSIPTQPTNAPPVIPSNPSPEDGAENQEVDITLTWNCSDPENDPLVYNIYFGTSEIPSMLSHDKRENSRYLPGLNYNQTYYWRIVAKDDHGHKTESPIWSFVTINRPPDTPADPSPPDSSVDQAQDVNLYWNCSDPDGDSLSYDVYFGTSENPVLVGSNQTEHSFDPDTLEFNQKYYWKIVARDNSLSTEGPVWNFTTAPPGNQPPNAPSNPSPEDEAEDQTVDVDLDWDCSDPEGDPLTYDVYFGTSDDPDLIGSDQSESSYDPGILEPHQTYYWKIVAKDDHDHFREGAVWSFTTFNTLPDSPSNPSPEDGASEQEVGIAISWDCSDPDGDALTYDVYFDTTENPQRIYTGLNTNSYEPVNMSYRQTYYWKIIAKDDQGDSTESPVWSFTTVLLGNQPPLAPSNPGPADGSVIEELDIDLEWNCIDLDGDTLVYDVYFGTSEDSALVDSLDPSVLLSSEQVEDSYDLDVLEYNQPYYWKIVAKDGHEHSTAGQVWGFIINRPPMAPSEPTPIDGASDQMIYLNLNWVCSDPDGDTLTYDVYLGTEVDALSITGNIDTCTFEPEDLEYSSTFYWKIVAKDDYGHSTESEVWSFETTGNLPPAEPSNPFPADRAEDQPIDAVLSWECSDPYNDPLIYDVYFGTYEDSAKVADNHQSVRISEDQDETSFASEDLEYRPYCWKVVAKDGHGLETESPLWSYKTPSERDFDLGDSDLSISMVWIPRGSWAVTESYMMGAQMDERDAQDDEYPRHQVYFDYGFWMAKYELTQAQWEAVMGSNPSKLIGENRPVERVSWEDVESFLDNLEQRTPFRLPTEAEWEFACRAGNDEIRFPWGDDPDYEELGDYAWYDGNSGGETHDVGQKQPNPWGLHDMQGNVWEWCEDSYHDSYDGAPDDGDAWTERDNPNYVFRGGSWFSDGALCRSAERSRGGTNYFSYTLGFRLVRDVR